MRLRLGPAMCRTLLWDLVFLRRFVVANEPEYDTESQGRSCQGCNHTRRGLIKIENDKSAHQGEQRDQHNGPHLNDRAAMMPHYQQRVLEFKRDEHSEHHTKDALEHLRIGEIDTMALDKVECMQKQLPGCDRHDAGDNQREHRHDRLLELFIDRERLPFSTRRSEERRVGKEGRSRWSPYH